jgi:hypothetical protein
MACRHGSPRLKPFKLGDPASIIGRTSTQGPKITEENTLPLLSFSGTPLIGIVQAGKIRGKLKIRDLGGKIIGDRQKFARLYQ